MKESTKLPLAGLTVLDLSRVLAGPWATQMLGDLGARVIKVERPGDGDDTRRWGPPFSRTPDGQAGDAAYFLAANRNKASIAIDFAKPEGADLIRSLAAKADILVENFKTGALAKYGLDYATISTINTRLVYCSITGFGHDGPYADRAGYDFMIQAMGGLMSITGNTDESGGEPVKVGVAVADLFAGMYAGSAILAALRYAERTGIGQHIDVSLFDCQLAMLANQAANYFMTGRSPGRLGNAHPNIAPYQAFTTADRPIIIAVGNDRQFATLCKTLGVEEYVADPRFKTNHVRVQNRTELSKVLTKHLTTNSASHWLAAFEHAGVPAGPINTIEEAFDEQQVHARKMRRSWPQDMGSGFDYVPYPVKFSESDLTESTPAPQLGADTDSTLANLLNLDRETLRRLREENIIE